MLLVGKELTNICPMSSVLVVGPVRESKPRQAQGGRSSTPGCRAAASPPALGAGHRRFESSRPDCTRKAYDQAKRVMQDHSGIGESGRPRWAHNPQTVSSNLTPATHERTEPGSLPLGCKTLGDILVRSK